MNVHKYVPNSIHVTSEMTMIEMCRCRSAVNDEDPASISISEDLVIVVAKWTNSLKDRSYHEVY